LAAQINKGAWYIPSIFNLIQKQGNVREAEMYQVFNMGIGMAIICSPQQLSGLTSALPEVKVIGKVIPTREAEKVIIT